ncbi:MarR family winged helix-turn-helix transcriptional regulator [Actinokineospora sp.]|uniref:MarR family winged helix-turn-helix transcriptional regulator n=1 Tax=Actinokineospora sp. TaxID=1872133 RepID=UPI004037D429
MTVALGDHMATSLGRRGLTRARATIVWRLFHDGAMTQRRLSQALKVTPRNVTGLLDGLEEGGFVARNPHPTDRRATLVTITAKGRAAARAMHEDHERFAASLFAELAPDALTALHRTLTDVLRHLDQQTDADGGTS